MKKFKFNRVQKKRLLSIISGAVLFSSGGIFTLLGFDTVGAAMFIGAGIAAGIMCVVRAVRGIIGGTFFDENTLMTVAAAGAIALGEYPECAAVMILYQIGELFQSIAVGKSRRAIQALSSLCPDSARVLKGGEFVEIPASEIEIGCILQIRAGERIPADCTIIEGETTVDTSPVTGESVPRDAKVGDMLYSGCVNQSGLVKAKAVCLPGDSAAGRIIRLTETAGERKTKSEAFITRFAKIYTPCVAIFAAIIAFLVPLAIMLYNGTPYPELLSVWGRRAISMLVISCPCALVISVPLGYFCGLGNASKNGILIKGSTFVDTLAAVDTAVFDKTGTLTEGALAVAHADCAEGWDEAALLSAAAAAEQNSSHPIAKAIVGKADGVPEVESVTEISGKGVDALLKDGRQVNVFRPEGETEGTAVDVTVNGASAGRIYLSDTVKEGAREALSSLKKNGVRRCIMLTGDNASAAEAVAGEVGIDEVLSRLLPEEKFENIERLCSSGCVMYAGDGINDAPSLARADVGVAMGAIGSGAAIEAADVVLMSGDLRRLAEAKKLCRRTVATVRVNIVMSLAVKLAVLALAAVNLVGMWAAVLADVGVCILAVSNSMRLLK